jgi:AGZA family xanthine/uracil permease-like MFS transporter
VTAFFDLVGRKTTVAREARGALATFLTMAYILIANAQILSAAGVPMQAAVAGTALTAGLASILMGLGANVPIALAPGMGLNAVIAFQAVPAAGGSWPMAMGLVVLDGLIVLLLVLLGIREAVVRAIPVDLRRAIGVGIGLFIVFLGLVQARIVVVPASTVAALSAAPGLSMPPVTAGGWAAVEPFIAGVGVVLGAVLLARGQAGAMLLAIAVSALFALATGHMTWVGVAAAPHFDTLFKADVLGALQWQLMPLLFALVLVDFFDTVGTVTAIGEAAGLTQKDGLLPRIRQVLAIDAIAAILGGTFGASSATSYIESAAGVAEGARTGLHSVFVGLLFLASMVLAPLASAIPAAATAPALILTGLLMCRDIGKIDITALDTAIPAFLTVILVPLTYSISHGIGGGFIAYVAIKLLNGRARDIHPLMAASAAAFLAFFAFA